MPVQPSIPSPGTEAIATNTKARKMIVLMEEDYIYIYNVKMMYIYIYIYNVEVHKNKEIRCIIYFPSHIIAQKINFVFQPIYSF